MRIDSNRVKKNGLLSEVSQLPMRWAIKLHIIEENHWKGPKNRQFQPTLILCLFFNFECLANLEIFDLKFDVLRAPKISKNQMI